jgi:hypothetical protein
MGSTPGGSLWPGLVWDLAGEGAGYGSGDDRGGAGGDRGRGWRFRRARAVAEDTAALPSGSAELVALEQAPGDEQRAIALAEVLVARADADSEFGEALQAWWAQASQLSIGGDVTNTISGGTFHGPVLQGRDFTGLTFTTPPPAPPARDPGA